MNLTGLHAHIHTGATIASLSLLISMTGCGGTRDVHDTGPHGTNRATFPAEESNATSSSKPRAAAADLDALLPSKMRIHPLTRFERAPGKPGDNTPQPWQIACHIELRDAFGHTTKGLGRLRIELYRPVAGRTPGGVGGAGESQDAVWNIDLRDPRENGQVYDDLITRTYTVYLASLPRWLEDWATNAEQRRAADRSAPGERDSGVLLKAYFITTDRTGRERVFESSYRIPD